MIVDTAVHYLEPPRPDRPNDPEGSPPLPMPIEEAIREAVDIGVDALVQMTPSSIGYDNRYNLEAAQRYPDRVLGIFGRFNPVGDDVGVRLKEFAKQDGVLGVRILIRKGPSELWLEKRELDPFLKAVEEAGIGVSFYRPVPSVLRETARRFPGVRMVAEHSMLFPSDRVSDPFEDWDEIKKTAAEPNIWTQVSYFPETAPRDEAYPFPSGQRRFKDLYESVGAARMIWGAHFPLIRNLITYRQALEFVRVHCDFLSEKDRKAILGDNFVEAFVPASRRPKKT